MEDIMFGTSYIIYGIINAWAIFFLPGIRKNVEAGFNGWKIIFFVVILLDFAYGKRV